MKKKVLVGVLLCNLLIQGIPVMANEKGGSEVAEGVYILAPDNLIEPEVLTTDSTEPFEAKTAVEREQLSAEEQQLVNEMEGYLNEQVDLKSRGLIESQLDKAVVNLAFDFGFNRDNSMFGLIANLVGDYDIPHLDWFNSLTNVSERTLQVYDEPTGKNVILRGTYIDNGASETVIVHHGYRGDGQGMMDFIKLFADQGYNVLFPDARSHGKSEGRYITFGHYEKDDLTKWIEQEVAVKPDQEIILMGVSMGAATTVLSQDTPHPSVKAYIEDCGYSSAEQQYKDTLHLLTQYLQYIPIVNLKDWDAKEDELIYQLNEQKIKSLLKFDLYSVSPLESVSKMGVPKLFIHGDADWFIPPVAMTQMYNQAIGYKEQVLIANAGHGEALGTDRETYTNAVFSFLETIKTLNTKQPEVAADVNLIQNPFFKFNQTHFENWETSTTFDNQGFSQLPLVRNSYSEFILKKAGKKEVVTATQKEEGIRFFTRYGYNDGLVGQNVQLIAGETYELKLNAKNETGGWLTYPNVIYGIDGIKKEDPLKSSKTQSKTVVYQATETKDVKVKIGSKLGRRSLLGSDYSHTLINGVSLVNADRTPPAALELTELSWNQGSWTIRGKGEPRSLVQVADENGKIVSELLTEGNGFFTMTLTEAQGSVRHLINQDVKGNRSESRVLVF